MHRFVESQSFNIRPVKHASLLVWHPLRIKECLKRYKLRFRGWLNQFQQSGEGKTDPGDHHRPALNTAEPVDSFLKRKLQKLVQIKNTDRKSTRLNSTHGYISYAVLCLKNN